jgi:RNA recognition motif-containing protein
LTVLGSHSQSETLITSKTINPLAATDRPRPHRLCAVRLPGSGPKGEYILKKLYVGNLPFDATADELREMFSPYGRVMSATICSDRETGNSRGFAFVEMVEGAEEAINALNQARFGSRSLTVNEAKPRDDNPASRNRYSRVN